MNTAQDLTNALSNWKTMGMSKAELVVKIAEFCMGWPYVWGGLRELCTPTNRENSAKRSDGSARGSAAARLPVTDASGIRVDRQGFLIVGASQEKCFSGRVTGRCKAVELHPNTTRTATGKPKAISKTCRLIRFAVCLCGMPRRRTTATQGFTSAVGM